MGCEQMNDLTYDYVHGTDIYLYQRRDMFRMNTDTALLAHFMKIKKGERVLDIGCNNGALLLMAARFSPHHLYGIDIQEDACALALYNMKHAGIRNVSIQCGDVRSTTLAKVDVIVCNPPYFKVDSHSNVNVSKALRIARHETYLPFAALCACVSSLLDEKGRFYFVHRANRISELIVCLHNHRLAPRSIQFVYDHQKTDAISVLVEAIKDGKANTHVRPGESIDHLL